MKKIVPFTKDLMFKTKIGEITSISLDHTLKLEDNFVSGEFIIFGTYKLLETSELEEKFDYKVPVDITIDSKYETKNCVISIDDFSYEIVNEDTLKVNISVMLDDLDIKLDPIEKIEIDTRDMDFDIIEEIPSPIENTKGKNENPDVNNNDINNVNIEINSNVEVNTKKEKNIGKELFDNLDSSKEYSIYRVYTMTIDDTIDTILEKFNVTKEVLADYNDLDNLVVGSKIIIPSLDE